MTGFRGVELAFDDVGEPDAETIVVLLHGGAQTRHSWRATSLTLAANGARALAVDLRGHGESQWAADGDYSAPALVEDLRRVVEHAARPVVLVGASLGGLVAILFCARHPELARALVLVDVVPRNNPAGVERIRRFIAASPDGFESFSDAVAAVSAYRSERTPPTDSAGLRRNLRRGATGRLVWHWDRRFLLRDDRPWTDGREHLLVRAAASLTLPTVLLAGGDSDVVDVAAARAFQDLVPHAEVRVVPGAGHMLAADVNDEFCSELLAVMDELASRP